jgi:Protein of unknown function (DUF2442)
MIIGKIIAVSTSGGHKLAFEWDDGFCGVVDFTKVIAGHQSLAPLGDTAAFENLSLSEDGWSIEWACGIDFGTAQLRRWVDEQAGETMPSADFRHWMATHKLTLDATAQALGLSRRTIAYYLSGEQPVPKTVMLATIGYGHLQSA